MKIKITQLAALWSEQFNLYQKALLLGSEIPHVEPAKVVDILDQRDRILGRTAALKTSIKELEAEVTLLGATPSELAFVKEHQARVKDLRPKFLDQNRRLSQILKEKIGHIRGELAHHNTNANAIRKYLNAPGAKPLI